MIFCISIMYFAVSVGKGFPKSKWQSPMQKHIFTHLE